MKTKIYYKNWIWYYHLIACLLFIGFLCWGFYLSSFVEYWYSKNAFTNYDILMSFFSVQVNIMTIVWLIIYIINFDKKEKHGIITDRFRMTIMNLNMLVFLIFWMGVVYYVKSGEDSIANYGTNQIICTIVTHLICPILLFIIYQFSMGNERYEYNFYKKWDIYIVFIYAASYLAYVYIRGELYLQNLNTGRYPYPFVDFQNLFIGNSVWLYVLYLIITFFVWFSLQHLWLVYNNNLIQSIKYKRFVLSII
ncbi:unknown lipoprotein [Mesoplasma florum W37]|uniref:Transmembrane protein n=1 Tax=Mesoplasma florum TaxID=2151 RepID=A0AAD0HS45_MESFO|nr:hypothetical protein [Mesoplasma florum]AGY41544.1 unknown lipoprotein [Mesoplasma florum W37]AVN59752.1 hypothetical protein CG008_02490 [Mesoplasma florum]AVN65884.1 putative transmembrane protein [Mesoplasma florum]